MNIKFYIDQLKGITANGGKEKLVSANTLLQKLEAIEKDLQELRRVKS